MTTPSQVINLLQLVGGAGVLLLIFSGPWRKFVLDAVRQFLFQLRDRVFLLAADGKLAFDDPIYIEFRSLINGIIRNLHDFSIFNLVFADESDGPRETILDRINSINDPEVRNVLAKCCIEMFAVIFACMILRSLLFTVLFFPVAVCAAIVAIVDGPNNLWRISRKARGAIAHLDAGTQHQFN